MTFGGVEHLSGILAAGASALVLLVLYAVLRRIMIRRILKRGANLLIRERWKIIVSEMLLAVSVLLAVVTLLRPQWGERTRVAPVKGTDLIVVLDVSRSMLSDDVEPNRLERARSAVRLLADQIGGSRIALEVFAEDSFVLCPLTDDIGAFTAFLDSVSTESVPRQGTDIGKALEKADSLIKKKELSDKYLLLISDGEDHEGKGVSAAKTLASDGVTVYTASIGSTSGGIFSKSEQDKSPELDDSGKARITKADPDSLKRISDATGGSHFDLSTSYSGVFSLADIILKKRGTEKGSRMVTEPLEQYQLFGLLLFLLLLGEGFVSTVRFR